MDAATNEEFYARLGIEPAPKARGIREVMADNAQRVADGQALLRRLDVAAVKSGARAL